MIETEGKLYICATPIGNLSDITYRCVEVLKSVDLIAAEDTRHTLGLLNHFSIEKPMTSYFEHNRREKGEYILNELKSGKDVALVSDAGTPAISDPGEDLVRLCAENGITVVPVPGAVAGINALVVSGMDTSRFCFEGFLSVNKTSRRERLESLVREERTMIFYEAPHKLLSTLRDMKEAFGERKISLCREITKIHEEIIRTTFSEAIEMYEKEPPRGEFVLVVAGRDAKQNKEETRAEWMLLSEREHVDHYMAQGLDEKEAMRRAARDRGVSRRDLYDIIKR